MTVSLPEAFIRNIRRDIPGDADALFSVLDGTPPVSVRWNPYKTQSPAEGIPVAWCRYGRYLPERPSFTTDPLFHAGAYYVQEASSMFVEHLLRSTTEPEGARILDLCAAPGGKATLYSTLAGGDGIVIANEVIRSRALILADNIRKWGIGNTMVTNNDPAHFAGLGEWFDAVAVDAPCSGEGMFRKSPEARGEWSEANVRLCAARQRRIVSDAWAALRPGGVLIYSTCTFNRTEDEENVRWIAEELGCRAVSIDEFKKNELKNYDNVIYGGGVQAGGIKELDKFMKWIKSDLKLLDMYRSGKISREDLEKSGVAERHYAIFAVGINLDDTEARQQLRDINFPKNYMKQLPCFYLPGEYHPENLKGADKMIMNLAQKMMKGKREAEITDNDKIMISYMENGCNLIDRQRIRPIIEEMTRRKRE